MGCRIRGWLSVLAVLVAPSLASGQELVDGERQIDLVDLPVFGSGRAVSMGGAFTGVGSGIDAAAWTPAAFATRSDWETSWFAWDVSLGILFPGSMARTNYFNTGAGLAKASDFVYGDVGLRLQLGPVGGGALARIRRFDTRLGDDPAQVDAYSIHVGGAVSLLRGQLVVGLAGRVAQLRVTSETSPEPLVDFQGAGLEAGATLRLAGRPYRLGLVVRTPVRTQVARSSPELALALPRSVHMPWEVDVGVSYQLGAKELNPARDPPLRPRVRRRLERLARALPSDEASGAPGETPVSDEPTAAPAATGEEAPGVMASEASTGEGPSERERYYLLSADVLVVGRSRDGIGLDGFLDQRDTPRGRSVSCAVRLGAELEPWLDRLKLRFGTYLEPARTQRPPRLHGTFGFDLRLFRWDLFGKVEPFAVQASFTVDGAAGYVTWGFGVGLWH